MKKSPSHFQILLAAAALMSAAVPARAGLNINATFDSTVTSDPNAALIEAGINATIARFQSAISNNITVSIDFQEMGTGLGQSQTSFYLTSYSNYRSLLVNDQTLSANDITALASLPTGTTNPVTGSSTQMALTSAVLRALGQNTPGAINGTFDSVIGLNTSLMNLSRTGAQNPSAYDLQAVAAHEIDEALGIGGSGSWLGQSGGYTGALDLFRYSAAGVRSFATSASSSYFSINGGTTDLVNFNQNGGADYADWALGTSPIQVQDAYGSPGAIVNIGTTELTALDVVGYTLAPVPEPCSAFFGVALCGLSVMRRRRSA